MRVKKILVALTMTLGLLPQAQAFFFYFQTPRIGKPAALQSVIDQLQKTGGVRAVAFVAEDKAIGSKQWIWGQASGAMTQDEANAQALKACESELARLQKQMTDGKPTYDFGLKLCELHVFPSEEKSVQQK